MRSSEPTDIRGYIIAYFVCFYSVAGINEIINSGGACFM